MENNIKFTLMIETLNQKIADLNIRISKDSNNIELQQSLNDLLADKEKLYNGTLKDLEELTLKYGETYHE